MHNYIEVEKATEKEHTFNQQKKKAFTPSGEKLYINKNKVLRVWTQSLLSDEDHTQDRSHIIIEDIKGNIYVGLEKNEPKITDATLGKYLSDISEG